MKGRRLITMYIHPWALEKHWQTDLQPALPVLFMCTKSIRIEAFLARERRGEEALLSLCRMHLARLPSWKVRGGGSRWNLSFHCRGSTRLQPGVSNAARRGTPAGLSCHAQA